MIPIPIRNLHIHKTVKVGKFTAIGENGFHYRRDKTGKLIETPHTHGVIIEKDVLIGSHCSVDAGRWRDTIIGEGTKIDDHVHISHNVRIGKDCIIAVGTILLGSVEVGDGAEIWAGAIIHQGVKIGKNAVVGAGSYVRHDVPDNYVVYGNPGDLGRERKHTKEYKEEKKDMYVDRNQEFIKLSEKKEGGVVKTKKKYIKDIYYKKQAD